MSDETARAPLTGLGRLWQPPTTESATPRLGLTTDRVVQAAIELADAEGLEQVSMARVAERLGFSPMSLYRHVTGKDELVLLMHDAAWMPAREPAPLTGSWRADVAQWCRDQQQVLRLHGWLERVRMVERAGTPSQLTWMDRGLRALGGTPLTERDKTEVLLLLNGYVFWEARIHVEVASVAGADGVSMQDATQQFGELIRTVVDPSRFPALRQAVDSGAFDDVGGPAIAEFDAGLDVLLAGIEVRLQRRATEAATEAGVGPS